MPLTPSSATLLFSTLWATLLPRAAGNALQARLRQLSILHLAEPLAQAIEAGEDIPPGKLSHKSTGTRFMSLLVKLDLAWVRAYRQACLGVM